MKKVLLSAFVTSAIIFTGCAPVKTAVNFPVPRTDAAFVSKATEDKFDLMTDSKETYGKETVSGLSVISTFDINITEMTTHCESAPNWGSPLFTAKVTISVAKSMDLDKVKLAIEDITDDLMVEIENRLIRRAERMCRE